MAEAIQVRWTWDRVQYLKAERESWLHAPGRTRSTRRILFLSTLAFALFVWVYWQRGLLSLPAVGMLAMLTLGLPWLGQEIGVWVTPRIRAYRFAKNCLPAYGETRAAIGTAGLALRWQDSSIELGWSAFLHAVESPSFFFLYHSPAASYFLPKASIAEELLPVIREQISVGMAERGGLNARMAA